MIFQKKNKWLSFLIATTLFLLTACQSNNPSDLAISPSPTAQKTATRTSTSLPTSTPTQTPTPAWLVPISDLKKVEITLIHPWSGELAATLDEMVATFNKRNEYGIQVSILQPGSSQKVFQQSEAALRSGTAPDVVIATAEELAYWNKMGNLRTLDDYLIDSQYGLNPEQVADFIPQFWEQDVVDESRLGIPVAGNANFLLLNTSWAKELGYDIPAITPQLFQLQSCSATQALLHDSDWTNNGMGGWVVTQDEYTILNWLNSFQLAPFPTTETPYLFDQPAALKGFSYLRELLDADCAWNARNPSHYEYFANRQALYVSADMYDLEPVQKTFTLLENEDKWQVVAYPQESAKPELLLHGESLGILKSDNVHELASWLFIRWLSQPEQQLYFAQANPGLPVSQSVLTQISSDRSTQWNQVSALLKGSQPGPRTAEWRIARFVLQDAAYQIFLPNITPDQFPQILKMLDAIIADLNQQPASLAWE